MRTGEVGAAGLFDGFEFHEFDAGIVGVVEIELPFAVAADFRLFAGLHACFDELLLDDVDVCNAESDVVHDAERVFVGVGRDAEHVFDPVGAVGDLHGDPVGWSSFMPPCQ